MPKLLDKIEEQALEAEAKALEEAEKAEKPKKKKKK